jgi:hypothetical protein
VLANEIPPGNRYCRGEGDARVDIATHQHEVLMPLAVPAPRPVPGTFCVADEDASSSRPAPRRRRTSLAAHGEAMLSVQAARWVARAHEGSPSTMPAVAARIYWKTPWRELASPAACHEVSPLSRQAEAARHAPCCCGVAPPETHDVEAPSLTAAAAPPRVVAAASAVGVVAPAAALQKKHHRGVQGLWRCRSSSSGCCRRRG